MRCLLRLLSSSLLALLLLTACSDEPTVDEETPPAPTATFPAVSTLPPTETPLEPTATPADVTLDFITVAMDTPSRNGLFSDFDEFGNVIGLDAAVVAAVEATADIDIEIVNTKFDGMLEAVSGGNFDAALSAIVIPNEPEEGIAYSIPYLVTGQSLVVLANDMGLESPSDVTSDMTLGYVAFTRSQSAAEAILDHPPNRSVAYEDTLSLLQGLIDGEVRIAIVDSYDAETFADRYYQQLKIVGGGGEASWIASQSYGIAISAENQPLLDKLNAAIRDLRRDGTLNEIAQARLVETGSIDPGESLIGTPEDRIIVGLLNADTNLDPTAAPRTFAGWEFSINTLGGLYHLAPNGDLLPALAQSSSVDETLTEYTFELRDGLAFPDGTPLSAEQVVQALTRASQRLNVEVNRYLKDEDENGLADSDAVQAIDERTVTITLNEPTAEFLDLLATPPFFITHPDCPTADFDLSSCSGIGPYTVMEVEAGQVWRLDANPNWPLSPPTFDKVELRNYATLSALQVGLLNGSVDIASGSWTGAEAASFDTRDDFVAWSSPAIFKSYLVFEHDTPPWDDQRVRLAAAYAIDRDALLSAFGAGSRQTLFSPIPTSSAESIDAFPERDLQLARALLLDAGFSATEPAQVQFWYVNDGRYSTVEEQYATLIAEQLRDTQLFEVEVQGLGWPSFIGPRTNCALGLYLQGWPAPVGSQEYAAPLPWLNYFVTNTDTLCSNYESEEMDTLFDDVRQAADDAARSELYGEIQTLWAKDLPTVPLTESGRYAVSLNQVSAVALDSLGLIHYGSIDK